MFCSNCGIQIEEGADFCHKCGKGVVYSGNDASIQDTQWEAAGECGQEAAPTVSEAEKEPSKFEKWWDNCSKATKICSILGAVLIGILALRMLISFLREFGYLLFGLLVIASLLFALFKGSKEERQDARKTILQLVVGFVVIFVIAYLVVAKADFVANFFQPGAGVRNAYLSQYSEDVTVGDAFDSFFENGKWSTYKEGGYSYVAFNGRCEYMGEMVDVKVSFKTTGENFIVDSLDINGSAQNDLLLYALLSKIYEEY